MERKLRYSERKRLAERGSLDDLVHEEIPTPLRTAVTNLLERDVPFKGRFLRNVANELIEHFGRSQHWFAFVSTNDVDEFLDFLEIVCEQGSRVARARRGSAPAAVYYPDITAKINNLLERHRFGYRIEGGEVRKIGSPALDEVIVGKALLAVQRPGWNEVENDYRKALGHQRAGEVDDALTSANAAVESALKAVAMKGTSLGPLAKSFKSSSLAPSYLADVPELLEDLLGKLMAARSTHGDAHGKAPGAQPGEQALADLAVYWAGAFVAYLAEIAP